MKEWKWLGHKQHLCVARRCQFNLATLLPNGYLVSTIGEYFRKDDEQFQDMEEIGADRMYETYVFKTEKKLKDCGCPEISSYTEVESDAYNEAKDAQEGHIRMCLKIEKLERIKE